MKRSLLVLSIITALALLGVGGYLALHKNQMAAPGTTTLSADGREIEYYTCSMHPFIREPKPGPCPVCGMKLYPVYKQPAGGAAHDTHAAGLGSVTVSAEEERLLGIRTVTVRRGQMQTDVKTVGRVEVNEENLEHVHTRFEGWVQNLYVNSVGQMVQRGDPLFSIYSPQVVATQEEYLLAFKAVEKLRASTEEDARHGAQSMLKAARERLVLWEVPDETLRRLEATQRVEREITINSHASGYVIQRNVTAGQQIMAGTDLYLIADLSDIWVTAEVYERDLSRIRIGQSVIATFAGQPGRTYNGKITFIYPFLDETTRTNKIRIGLANPGLLLKPGMFGDITISARTESTTAGSSLIVPVDAVMITGERNIVFVQRGRGTYEPVEVKLGGASGGSYVILEGLHEGDVIVERGNFFLDSESQLRMTGSSAPKAPPGQHWDAAMGMFMPDAAAK